MANPKQPPSDELGEVLRRLLDESGVYKTRREWAAQLQVTESLISRWVSGDTMIRPEHLEEIIQAVENQKTDTALATLSYFWAQAVEPANKIAPLRTLKCTLGEWLVLASREKLLSELSLRSPEHQRQMFRVFVDIARLV